MRVFVCRRIPENGTELLEGEGLEVTLHDSDLPIAREHLLEQLSHQEYAALLCTLSERVDEELLEAAGGELSIVANFAVGYDNIDLSACRRRGVKVSTTPEVLSAATAEQTLLLMLAVARRLSEGERLARSGKWQGWAPLQLLGHGLAGKTLGIIGLGRIGREVAKRAKAFDMKLMYHNRNRDEAAERALGARYCATLDALLEASDVVSLNAPLTEDTRHLVGAGELARMKPTAILVNTARGPLVDEQALTEALSSGVIWGAGLDVYEFEPRITEALKRLPNVVLAPHLGSATVEARAAMARLCAEAIVAVLGGETVPQLLES